MCHTARKVCKSKRRSRHRELDHLSHPTISSPSIQYILPCAIRLAELARANVTVGTELDHLSLATSNVHLAYLLVETAAQIVVLNSDGKEMLLEVIVVPPIAGKLAGELVVIEMNLLQLARTHGGVANGDCTSELQIGG